MYQSPQRKKAIFRKEKRKNQIETSLSFVRYWTILINNMETMAIELLKCERMRKGEAEKSRGKKNYDALWSKQMKKDPHFIRQQVTNRPFTKCARCIFILTRHRLLGDSAFQCNNYWVFAAFAAIADFYARGYTWFPIFVFVRTNVRRTRQNPRHVHV